MAAADLVICRAGAATLAEATAAGAALLLVPYPHAASNHQLANAQFFKKNGAAEVCEQIALTPAWLADFLQKTQKSTLATLALKARRLARADATTVVAQCCLHEAGEKNIAETKHAA
jgi:UDP-N-acetylglucosamine--N-acetylmuramyl-(pentapeptide) pyrophosphoryl-undecaprenol N-acetylglucosamine transferase